MINNRQGGRRRGRGGQRPQGMGGSPGGNRQDNRQRGNAAQLLEKYKSLARDAQLAGDRVQTEYYLQYADHYFRVLEEGRSRYEEQQSQRRRRDEDDDDIDGDEEMIAEDSGEDEDEGETETRQRPQRRERAERPQRERFAGDRGANERSERPDRPRRERANGNQLAANEGDERIALGVLPPSIGASEEAEGEAPKPRRRVRKPREDNGDEVAPAA